MAREEHLAFRMPGEGENDKISLGVVRPGEYFVAVVREVFPVALDHFFKVSSLDTEDVLRGTHVVFLHKHLLVEVSVDFG